MKLTPVAMLIVVTRLLNILLHLAGCSNCNNFTDIAQLLE